MSAYPDFHRLPRRLPLWTRVRLWFRPTRVVVDFADTRYVAFYKELDGRFYLVGEHSDR